MLVQRVAVEVAVQGREELSLLPERAPSGASLDGRSQKLLTPLLS